MTKQIILVVEADKRARTDNIYIKSTLDRFYKIGNDVNINYVNMGGKSKYKAKDITRKINELIRLNTDGENVVIYCVDTDSYECNYVQKQDFLEIQKYIKNNGYELIWFCHDVEEVYLGKIVDKDEKKKIAVSFVKKGDICKVDSKKLNGKKMLKGFSNILHVLDRYLERL